MSVMRPTWSTLVMVPAVSLLSRALMAARLDRERVASFDERYVGTGAACIDHRIE